MTREEEKLLEVQMREIKQKLSDAQNQKKLDIIASHKAYIGKCYKVKSKRLSNDGWNDEEIYKYFKIISEVSENEYHVECFKFSLPVFCRFDRKLCMTASRYPDATIECEPFGFYSEGIFCSNSGFEKWIEINQEEFSIAMDECYREMIEITNKSNLSDLVLTR